MNRFKEGQRVFDKECGEFGKVLQYTSKQTVAVEYDQDFGCESNICSVDVEHLELV